MGIQKKTWLQTESKGNKMLKEASVASKKDEMKRIRPK